MKVYSDEEYRKMSIISLERVKSLNNDIPVAIYLGSVGI